ncbi:MAG: DUF444 family protein [Candidatus Shapirobacteria bacterium]
MSIVVHDSWDLSEKCRKDRQRHNEKVDKAIRDAARDTLADESIITKRGERTVRIPVKGLKEWRFIFDHNQKGKKIGGAGQGKIKPGDTIAKKNLDQEGKAGNQPGEDIIEVDVSLEYLLEIMFEELGLPNLEDKEKIENLVSAGFKFDSIAKKGIHSQLHKKKTILESIKRFAADIRELMLAGKCSEDDAKRAYYQAKHDLKKALKIILTNSIDKYIDPNLMNPMINDEDLRFRRVEENFIPQSRAVVILMCDSSGSMGQEKKYLMRSLFFWLTQFVRQCYEYVEIRFITHDTTAKLVDEDEFFKKGESGGTYCYTAFEMANHLLQTVYPVEAWNAFCLYCSDGDSWDVKKDIAALNHLIDSGLSLFGYYETHPSEVRFYGFDDGELLSDIIDEFDLKILDIGKNQEFYKNVDKRMVAGIIRSKEDVFPALKATLYGKR